MDVDSVAAPAAIGIDAFIAAAPAAAAAAIGAVPVGAVLAAVPVVHAPVNALADREAAVPAAVHGADQRADAPVDPELGVPAAVAVPAGLALGVPAAVAVPAGLALGVPAAVAAAAPAAPAAQGEPVICDFVVGDIVAAHNAHIGINLAADDAKTEWTLCRVKSVSVQRSGVALLSLVECFDDPLLEKKTFRDVKFDPDWVLLAARGKRGVKSPTVAVGDRVLAQFQNPDGGLTAALYAGCVTKAKRAKYTVKFDDDGAEQLLDRTSLCLFGRRQH
jgi:hypothetical protein